MRKYLWIITILFAVIGAPNAHAQTTYTYTGNDFTNFFNLTCPSDCSIDGSFTVSSPLAAGTTTNVTPTAFDFYISTADSPTWTNLNGALVNDLAITTNLNDSISSWIIVLSSPNGYPQMVTESNYNGVYLDYYNPDGGATGAYILNDPGTWTVTPEPSSLTLWLLGIFAVGIMTHRARTAKRSTPSLL